MSKDTFIKRSWWRGAASCAFATAVTSGWADPPQYTVTPLAGFSARRLNDLGVIVGDAYDVPGVRNGPALYHNGTITPVGTVGEGALLIDNDSDVVFSRSGAISIWNGSTYTSIPALPGANSLLAAGMNDADQVVGTAYYANGGRRAFLYKNGVSIDLTPPGATKSSATGINQLGQVTGYYNESVPFVYDNGTYKTFHYDWDLTGTAVSEYPTAINDLGVVVGTGMWSLAGGYVQIGSFYTESDGLIVNFGSWDFRLVSGTLPTAINNRGQIVGTGYSTNIYGDVDWYRPSAFLFDRSVGTLPLDQLLLPSDSGWVIDQAFDINERGQIIAYGHKGDIYSSLLVSPVPEPTSIAFVTLGAVALLRRRKG